MSQLYSNCPPYWNPNNQRISESLSKGLSLKMDSPPQLRQTARPLVFHLQDQDSSSSQSTQSNHDLSATAGTNSQDQCMSSESGQQVSCGKNVGAQAKPVHLMGHPDAALGKPQIDYTRTTTCVPYPYVDPYFNGLLTAYGPAPIIQPQMIGMTSARVPLPLDICEDEPIYVNAKQYHGILRRRQSRAKLEAQNKLIKVRKPYLHESRHFHALNRVRGSGGRFLSTKKRQQQDSSSTTGTHFTGSSNEFGRGGNTSVFEPHRHSQAMETATSNSCNGGGTFLQQQSDRGFLGISSSHGGGGLQRNGGLMNASNQQHCAPVVR